MEYARVDSRYLDLDQPKVQELLTLGHTRETNFQHTILRGAYLQEADLRDIDFTEANLDGADLRNADLRRAIFIRTIVTDVDFSGADLTGCCIKDWSFNRQTQFTGITCDYIYRSFEQNRPGDRYPIDRNFEPAEFEAMLQRIDTSFEFVVRDRLDPLALSFAFEKFRLEDEGLGLELQGVEQRGDVWIVKVGHKAGISPQQVEQHVNETYEDLRTLFEARYQLAISAKESEILRLNQTLNEVLQRFMQRSAGNFTIGGEGNRIYVVDEVSHLMESQNINAGRDVDLSSGTRVNVHGDVSGTLNLGEISGTVTNLVQQLNNSSVAAQQDLGNLLQNLQTEIEAEADLPDEQKKDALDAVATLAEEGKKTAENRTTKLCSMAVNALKGITSSLSDASKLAECFQISLPLIKVLLGLP
ncbi:pentapeptide repeat-containing protein [Alkalinema pantanalense CENA528]|uniref:pentapeptide repeat-containing protein n=1 Tax=Alkalinema pantanalense TaxID=1620705 RepID=UPI003D6DEDD1